MLDLRPSLDEDAEFGVKFHMTTLPSSGESGESGGLWCQLLKKRHLP